MILPNGRIYGSQILDQLAKKLNLREGFVRDPVTGEEVEKSVLRKVYIM